MTRAVTLYRTAQVEQYALVRSRVTARPPSTVTIAVNRDPAELARFREDAAHFAGGEATGVVRPRSTDEVSACLRDFAHVLPVGAQSSLTGGATPAGDVVMSTERLTAMTIEGERIRAGAGVPLQQVQDSLLKIGRWFPPVPTYLGAFAGGAVATCAAGAATFKYGTVREWVEGLTVVLAGGDILSLMRGECRASDEGRFEIHTAGGSRTVRVPALRMPDVPKKSAGYFIQPEMDLVDLFIGSEGTLGAITEVTLRTAPVPGGLCRAFVPVPTEAQGIALVGELRRAAIDTWASRDANGMDVSAIEHLDARSIQILREDGVDRRFDITLPAGASLVLLIDLELSPGLACHRCMAGDCGIVGAWREGFARDQVLPAARSAWRVRRCGNHAAG